MLKKAANTLLYKPLHQAIYARALCMELRARGIDPAPLLMSSGIGEYGLSDDVAHLSSSQFLALCAAARSACEDPCLPLDWGRRITESMHGMVGTAVASAPDLKSALETLQRESVLRNTSARVELRYVGGHVRLLHSMAISLGDLTEFVYAPLAQTIAHALSTLLGDDVAHLRIELPFAAPLWQPMASKYFPCVLAFDAEQLAFQLPVGLLDRRNPVGQPATYAAALRQCELERLGLKTDLSTRIAAYLAARGERPPAVEEVASAFCLSPRSLRRELARVGTSYRQLVLRERMSMACRYIDDTSLSVEQIAWRIGYADTSNFIRAFRQVTGLTPEQYRRHRRCGPLPKEGLK